MYWPTSWYRDDCVLLSYKREFFKVLERTGIAEVQLVNTASSCPRSQIIPESSEKVEEVISALTLDRECRTVGKP